jgi:glycosyltransferase involved in cell wall biosynthesis
MLSQSRAPRRLLVVDSSDNHDEVVAILERIGLRFDIPVKIIKSKPGIAYQRNVGLDHVGSPIVMMPDDDSLWYSGYTEAIMKVYENDENEELGSVCGSVAPSPPPSLPNASEPYKIRWQDKPTNIGQHVLRKIGRFFQDPISIEYNTRLKSWYQSSWLGRHDVSLCSSFNGFQASFRSRLIRDLGYDELLGRYSLYEDREMMFRMMHTHIPVVAGDAKVYHYRSPEPRTSGIEWGVITILNRTYIVCKHAAPGSLSRSLLMKYCYYQLFLFLTRAMKRVGRRRVIGAWRGISCLPLLINASSAELPGLYTRMRSECLRRP